MGFSRFSIDVGAREERDGEKRKACSSTSPVFHKQLPINVTFHLCFDSRDSTTDFFPFDDKVLLWFITSSIRSSVMLFSSPSHVNLISRSCHPMGQVSSHLTNHWRDNSSFFSFSQVCAFALAYRRFTSFEQPTNHCCVLPCLALFCRMLFYLFCLADWPMVNYCKCEWQRERADETGEKSER